VRNDGQQAVPLTVTARRALISTVVVLALVVGALAVWQMRLILLLLLTSIVVACAMQPGVEALHARGIPRGVGIAFHYAALAGLLAVLLALAVPAATSQVRTAISALPEAQSEVHEEAEESQGLKRDLLTGLEQRLADLPSRKTLLEPGFEVTRHAVEVIVGIFFVFASAAYWLSERQRVERGVLSLLPRSKHETVSDTWRLIDLKLGAFVRGQLLLVVLVGAVLSFVFWVIGLPYWLLIGVFAGIVEIVPLIGPLAAGALAIGVGFTVSWEMGIAAGVAVLVVRVVEDYLVMPRVLGDAVGLTPIVVLLAVAATGVVLGGLAVLLAIPIAAFFVTLVDVLLLKRDPAEEEVPSVIFPTGDADPDSA
jgi:predicted PurR-regulated permease PerM